MATQISTVWDRGSYVSAKRASDSATAFAAAHVAAVLAGEQGGIGGPRGTSTPLVATIVWTKDGKERTSEVKTWQAPGQSEAEWQADHAGVVSALEAAIVAAGGTITSGP